jgi:hypothetical protein
VHAEALGAGAEVVGRAERIGEHEHASLRPPEGDLPPKAAGPNRNELERHDCCSRHGVMRDAEPLSERRTVAAVAIDQLDDAGRSPGRVDTILELLRVERIDQPDAAVGNERVRAALEELVGDPAESSSEFVAEAKPHPGESTGTP